MAHRLSLPAMAVWGTRVFVVGSGGRAFVEAPTVPVVVTRRRFVEYEHDVFEALHVMQMLVMFFVPVDDGRQ